jgi:hypothetical protein
MNPRASIIVPLSAVLLACSEVGPAPDGGGGTGTGGAADDALFATAEASAPRAAEGFERAHRFVVGWGAHRDPTTGLYPQNFSSTLWTPENSAADLWPFMVLTTALTDKALFDGQMRDTLHSERTLTSRVGPLPDDYDLATHAFATPSPIMPDVVFGSAEYVKDGLIPIAELLDDPEYRDRMIEIASYLCDNASVQTPRGSIPSTNIEVNGDVLLTTTRLHDLTGDAKYLDCAQKIAEYYLFDEKVINSTNYRLRDHGGEITAGLVEAYIGLKLAGGDVSEFRVELKKLLDRILEVARTPDGFFYNSVDLATGEPVDAGLADTWGYVYNGFYSYYLVEHEEHYRDEIVRTLGNLPKVAGYPWEGESQDGYADSIESAINLLNREPVPAGLDWVESQTTGIFWPKQKADGTIEGWHGDGNFARTTLMYALMHTRGTHAEPWRPDLKLGAATSNGSLYAHLRADAEWTGKLCFDEPRHRTHMKLPLDYPRLNQFPEWFTVQAGASYEVTLGSSTSAFDGADLAACIPVSLTAGDLAVRIKVEPVSQ